MELFERLKIIRTHLALTQTKFADELGLKQGSYSDIERGKVKKISGSTIKLLKIIYNVNPDWLNGNDEKMLLKKENYPVNASKLDLAGEPEVKIKCQDCIEKQRIINSLNDYIDTLKNDINRLSGGNEKKDDALLG